MGYYIDITMGYYIETPMSTGKAAHIIKEYGAKAVPGVEAEAAFKRGEGVVCVVENGHFDAAAFVHSQQEFDCFNPTHPDNYGDSRRRTWLVMDINKAKELSGYKR